jgi:para-aminobenzoate synthetase / 4-amino-4-deoxychorismate lyase
MSLTARTPVPLCGTPSSLPTGPLQMLQRGRPSNRGDVAHEQPTAAGRNFQNPLSLFPRDVARVRDYIAAGDTYQCNLTGRLRSRVQGDLRQLYADLALNQRARYAAFLDLGRHVIASASPELFFEWAGDRLLTRPMKGTAARGRTPAEDQERVEGLLGSAKERAENVIVVDLLRNDVSRIADVGSVAVPALCVPERYETLWQLTSDVTGRVPTGTGLVKVFRALFPSGSDAANRNCPELLTETAHPERSPE